jgi:transmembrane sensor
MARAGTMTTPDPLTMLGSAVARRQDALLEAPETDPGVRLRVAQFAAAQKHRPRASSRLAWLLSALVLIALGVVGVLFGRSPSEPRVITFKVGTPPVRGVPGELVSAPGDRSLNITFSEGTHVVLEPEARARVVALGPRGAELILEGGRARFAVVPRPHGEWSVRAGPFAVRVTGTRFDVAYDPQNDAFSLALREGKVTVSGCTFGEARPVEAGETVRSSCARAEPDAPAELAAPVERAAEAPSDGTSIDPAAAASRVEGAGSVLGRREAPATGSSPNIPGRTWIELARAGYYSEAYELTRGTFDAECVRRGADEVRLLGDTARLSGHPTEARRAYAEVRNRFPGSSDAAQAAFALGRLALQSAGDRVAAERWFETNLRERPEGPMAAIALGRVLELRLERGDRAGAEAAARQYLRRFPDGPRAAAARKLVGVAEGSAEPRSE